MLLLLLIGVVVVLQQHVVNKNKINKIVISIGLLFSVLFILLGNIRIGVDSPIKYMAAFGNLKDIPNLNIIEVWFIKYGPVNFTTLQRLLYAFDNHHQYGFGIYILRPIISFLFLDRAGLIEYPIDLNGFSKLGTYVWEFYIDFGYFGLIINSIVLGFFTKYLYEKALIKKDLTISLQLVAIFYCLFMSVFTNFYFTFFIWILFLFPYLLRIKLK